MSALPVIVIYALLMVIFAIYFSKREVKSGEDFMVAGHRLPLIVVIGTLTATWVGSGSLIGGAGFVYQKGPMAAAFYFLGAPLGILVMYFIAAKTRLLAKRTVPEMLEIRFGSLTRLLAAVFILITYISVLSYQFIAGGYILHITTGLPEQTGSFLTVLLVIVLACTGGLFSVSYTDVISAFIIVFGFILAIPFILSEVGGFTGLAASLPDQQSTWTGGLTLAQLIGYLLPMFIYIIGDQNLLQRFSASKDEKVAKKSTIGFFIGVLSIYSLITLLATSAIVLLPSIKPDTALIEIASQVLPLSVGSIILAAFTALLVTTANSFLLSMSGNAVYDLYGRFKGELNERQYLKISRIFVVLIGIVAYFLGTFFTSVLELSVFAFTMYGAALTPVILAGFFWKRATTAGAIACILTGGIATIIWQAMGKPFGWNAVLISLPLSILALVFVSLITGNKQNSYPTELTGNEELAK
ncbi:sodium:solute symporter family protein [Ammoniphilus sp. YIM 78166]|uniref:sodium:solute symporter family protein n=1 Tax=Ammoniphilus sp. YIM 78166 TaxID=1644106 RepID=UPI001F10CC61|nr:sodium:solute symporter family protein [Ammoniphilus sp. YIM 78166]